MARKTDDNTQFDIDNNGKKKSAKQRKLEEEQRRLQEEEEKRLKKMQKEHNRLVRQEISIILAALIAIALILCHFGLGGKYGQYLQRLSFGIFGFLSYIVGPLILLLVIYIVLNRAHPFRTIFKIIVGLLMFVTIDAFFQMRVDKNVVLDSIPDIIKYSQEKHLSGGLVGGVVCNLFLFKAFDRIFSYIIIIFALIVEIILFSGKALFTAMGALSADAAQKRNEMLDGLQDTEIFDDVNTMSDKERRKLDKVALKAEKRRKKNNEEETVYEEQDFYAKEDEINEKIEELAKQQRKLGAIYKTDANRYLKSEDPAEAKRYSTTGRQPAFNEETETYYEPQEYVEPEPVYLSSYQKQPEYSEPEPVQELVQEPVPEPVPEPEYIEPEYIEPVAELVYEEPVPEQPVVQQTSYVEAVDDVPIFEEQNYEQIPEQEFAPVDEDVPFEPDNIHEDEASVDEYEHVPVDQVYEDYAQIEDKYESSLEEKEFSFSDQQLRDKNAPKPSAESIAAFNRNPYDVSSVKKPEPVQNANEVSRVAESAGTVNPTIVEEKKIAPEKPRPKYIFPRMDMLNKPAPEAETVSEEELDETAKRLEATLESFGVKVTVTNRSCGPSVTRYELLPDQGVRVSKITNLADDIKMNLAASDIRIEAPIPGKMAVGIEVPNKKKAMVSIRSILESREFREHPSKLAFAVGKDIAGQNVIGDVAKMPHVLIAGSTGSGKSVCINTLIVSILYKADPDKVKFIMVDPKMVELSVYNGIPHLLTPVVTDPKKAAAALKWAVIEMTDRYTRFSKARVRDMKGFNEYAEKHNLEHPEDPEKLMPQIVIIVDELADLMMVAPGEVEESICRLAQMARAAGMHLVIATQRPSVNVITGLIKANVPSRIAFAVSSQVDSRTILDCAGAEKLLGKGDMLYYPTGSTKPVRIQGPFVSDEEITSIVDFVVKNAAGYDFSDNELNKALEGSNNDNGQSANNGDTGKDSGNAGPDDGRDPLFRECGKFLIESNSLNPSKKASIGVLQRKFQIGFNRAARVMEQLEEAGVVGPDAGTKPREILMSLDEFVQEFMQ